jgi:predicted Zn-dependent protease
MRSSLRPTFVLLTAISTAFVWSSAAAQPPDDAAKKETAKRHDANNVSALSESMEAVVQGSQKFVGNDVAGAILLFRKAVKLQPRNPVAQYALGEALFAEGKTSEAEAALMAADDAASQASPAKARVLFMLASCKERLHKWNDAKEVWRRYHELAQARPDAGAFPESATERARMVDEWAKLDAAYAIVRARIGNAGAAAAGAAPTAPQAPAGDAGK